MHSMACTMPTLAAAPRQTRAPLVNGFIRRQRRGWQLQLPEDLARGRRAHHPHHRHAAFVRDGSFADTNFGDDPELLVKDSTPGFKRESFITFDVASVDSIHSATLWLLGSLRTRSPSA